MVNSSLKEMTRNRQLKTGGFVMEFFSPSIGQILKNSGCDFTVLDMEHSGVGFETIKSAIRYCRAAELPTVFPAVL
jgi:2-keto-3-deoxy-L-rhamnonate aldolase RhmA